MLLQKNLLSVGSSGPPARTALVSRAKLRRAFWSVNPGI